MANAEVHGQQYAFGFRSSDAPTIANFTPRKASLVFEPEQYQEATDGEGHAEAIALSKRAWRQITGTITGYIPASLGNGGANAIANYFDWTVNGESRRFIVRRVSEPREKAGFVEVDLEIVSKKGIAPGSPIST